MTEVGYWSNRWVRPPGSTMRYHIGQARDIGGGQPAIYARCGIAFAPEGRMPRGAKPLEACSPIDCDESLHCKTCSRSLRASR